MRLYDLTRLKNTQQLQEANAAAQKISLVASFSQSQYFRFACHLMDLKIVWGNATILPNSFIDIKVLFTAMLYLMFMRVGTGIYPKFVLPYKRCFILTCFTADAPVSLLCYLLNKLRCYLFILKIFKKLCRDCCLAQNESEGI